MGRKCKRNSKSWGLDKELEERPKKKGRRVNMSDRERQGEGSQMVNDQVLERRRKVQGSDGRRLD